MKRDKLVEFFGSIREIFVRLQQLIPHLIVSFFKLFVFYYLINHHKDFIPCDRLQKPTSLFTIFKNIIKLILIIVRYKMNNRRFGIILAKVGKKIRLFLHPYTAIQKNDVLGIRMQLQFHFRKIGDLCYKIIMFVKSSG